MKSIRFLVMFVLLVVHCQNYPDYMSVYQEENEFEPLTSVKAKEKKESDVSAKVFIVMKQNHSVVQGFIPSSNLNLTKINSSKSDPDPLLIENPDTKSDASTSDSLDPGMLQK